jgi:hypothetical protein
MWAQNNPEFSGREFCAVHEKRTTFAERRRNCAGPSVAYELRCERRTPRDCQQHINQNTKHVIEKSEGPWRNVSVGFFQMNLICLTAHGCLRGTSFTIYKHAYPFCRSL